MKFPFFKKQDHSLKMELQELRGQFSTTGKRLEELEQQLQKATRLQYKTGKSLDDKLGKVYSSIQEQQQTNKAQNIDRVVENLINQIDDMDIVLGNLQEDHQWGELVKKWIDSTISALHELGIQDPIKIGDLFDPRLAEAIDTVPISDSGQIRPLAIAIIYKRTFINEKGELIRKGQVATVKEE
ncbi:nucleotide exchange factor GrpE [Evansella sp. AB-P1]|uniref:nucleotide exchange factor GrpE n=1 Tax=Evansella sp. AB-P1 TaxID=3037653 RepID=UPI00241FC72C|nr:nucleotide exchange factor GrpE [Evansella sp. AB-P1]MDG5789390.1 nucleotide exchange factor GrpE [Evansella sp. AB-P1]